MAENPSIVEKPNNSDKFSTNKKRSTRLFTPHGSRVAPVYQSVFDEDLKRCIVKKVNEFDIEEFIAASNNKTDLAMLRAQMTETGQIPSVSGQVVDLALFPENIHDLHNIVNSVDQRFNSLPESIQNVFGDKDTFLAALVSGKYESDIIKYYQQVAANSAKTTDTQPVAPGGDQ